MVGGKEEYSVTPKESLNFPGWEKKTHGGDRINAFIPSERLEGLTVWGEKGMQALAEGPMDQPGCIKKKGECCLSNWGNRECRSTLRRNLSRGRAYP